MKRETKKIRQVAIYSIIGILALSTLLAWNIDRLDRGFEFFKKKEVRPKFDHKKLIDEMIMEEFEEILMDIHNWEDTSCFIDSLIQAETELLKNMPDSIEIYIPDDCTRQEGEFTFQVMTRISD